VKPVMRAAYRLDAASGMAKLRQLAEWLRRDWEAAANSLLEGLDLDAQKKTAPLVAT